MKQQNNISELVFILDRSGSMSGLEGDTIGGFNATIERQRAVEGPCWVTTVLFDGKVERLHDRIALEKVPKMTEKDYTVRGCTALLDAIGGAIHHIGNVHKYAREEDRPAKTLYIITTDGMENASRKYSYREVRKMIRRRTEEDHWEFLFLGANIDAIEVAGQMGIKRSRAVNYHSDPMGTALNYEVLSKAVSKVRACEAKGFGAVLEDGAWKEEIEQDFLSR